MRRVGSLLAARLEQPLRFQELIAKGPRQVVLGEERGQQNADLHTRCLTDLSWSDTYCREGRLHEPPERFLQGSNQLHEGALT